MMKNVVGVLLKYFAGFFPQSMEKASFSEQKLQLCKVIIKKFSNYIFATGCKMKKIHLFDSHHFLVSSGFISPSGSIQVYGIVVLFLRYFTINNSVVMGKILASGAN